MRFLILSEYLTLSALCSSKLCTKSSHWYLLCGWVIHNELTIFTSHWKLSSSTNRHLNFDVGSWLHISTAYAFPGQATRVRKCYLNNYCCQAAASVRFPGQETNREHIVSPPTQWSVNPYEVRNRHLDLVTDCLESHLCANTNMFCGKQIECVVLLVPVGNDLFTTYTQSAVARRTAFIVLYLFGGCQNLANQVQHSEVNKS